METLILTRDDVAALTSLQDYLPAVERAFARHAQGRSIPPQLLHVDVPGGEFHVKAGGLELAQPYFALKSNGAFPANRCATPPAPAIQGVIILADATSGAPLALIESTLITARRTAAATAVAARRLARSDARVLALVGAGAQAGMQLAALRLVLPLKEVWVWSRSAESTARFVSQASATHPDLEVRSSAGLEEAVRRCDVCVTVTPSRKALVMAPWVPPGAFVAGVGADSPEKSELAPELLARAKVVVDHLEQCEVVGDLHHAIEAGLMCRKDVHAEFGEILTGARPGREAAEEIIVFDSTGSALQDCAAAALVYERALARGRGLRVALRQQQST